MRAEQHSSHKLSSAKSFLCSASLRCSEELALGRSWQQLPQMPSDPKLAVWLIHRTTRGHRLTSKGKRFLEVAHRVLDMLAT